MHTRPDQDLIEAIARAFSNNLRAALTKEQWKEVIARTPALIGGPICASADYCDANLQMAAALRAMGMDWEDHPRIWNRAWEKAKQNLFYANETR